MVLKDAVGPRVTFLTVLRGFPRLLLPLELFVGDESL